MSGSDSLSAWERLTWVRCQEPILGLKHRLGYGARLWVLGFELPGDVFFGFTHLSHPARHLADRLPWSGTRAFVRVTQRYGRDHLTLFAQPLAQFIVGIEHVADP